MDSNVALSMGIAWDKQYNTFITVEATKFDSEHKPIVWAIRRSSSVMSKKTGTFDYEPMPSNRDDEFFEEYRFDSIEEAIACWKKHNEL